MDISEFLLDEFIELENERDIKHFPSYISELFKTYMAKISLIDDPLVTMRLKDEKLALENLCSSILSAINKYYQGYPSEAYHYFEQGIENIKNYLRHHNIVEDELENLYRMRIGTNFTYKTTEMFHIPFELRSRVKTQRYSIPGLPCLYLGSSVYVCWEELGKPDVNSVQVSRFKAADQQNIKILDLGFSPKYIFDEIKSQLKEEIKELDINHRWLENVIIPFLIIWPLIRACSIKVDDRLSSFKPEYIIPQLLLQWITLNKDFDGIRYLSVNTDPHTASRGLFYNYVLPVKTNLEEGLCPVLKEKFKVTETVPWQVAKLLSLRTLQGNKGLRKIHLIPGIVKEYEETDFGYIEKVLNKMPTSLVN